MRRPKAVAYSVSSIALRSVYFRRHFSCFTDLKQCDELKPSCSRCSKKELECHYVNRDEASANSSRSPSAGLSQNITSLTASTTSAESPSVASDSQNLQYQLPPLPSGPSSADRRHPSVSALSRAHADLLDYWRNNTSRIFEVPAVAGLARTIVVDIAMNNPFLLHAILACGAVLKSLSMPYQSPTYTEAVLEAAEHETLSMALFRSTIIEVDQSNYEAVFMYTIIAALFVYSSFQPRLHDDAEERLHQLTSSNWIRTLRAIPDLMGNDCWMWLEQSPLFLFTYPGAFEAAASSPKDPVFQRMLEQFSQLSELWEDGKSMSQATTSADCNTYRISHTLLLESLARVAKASSPAASGSSGSLPASVAAAAWTVLMPTSFLDCLDRGTPESLLLLAHWGVLMSRVTGVYWIEGFGESVVKAVMQDFAGREGEVSRLDGDDNVDWRKCMEWPMRMVGGRL